MVPIEEVSSVSGSIISLIEGNTLTEILTINDIIPNEQQLDNNGQPYYSLNLTLITEKLTSDIIKKYRDRKVIVKLFTDDDGEMLLGSLDFPARCFSFPSLNADTFNISIDSPTPLIS